MSKTSKTLKPLGNTHHLSLRCRDAEQTRWFYEDILGLKLAAALSLEKSPGTEQERPFLHLFLELGDGNYIVFFDEPGHANPEHFELKDSDDIHIAFETDSRESVLAGMDKTADDACTPSHARRLFDAIGHDNKVLVEIRGATHYYLGQHEQLREAEQTCT
jgi:catechol 2,3-dioxygenase-like lactoylglutathione lyase family enzyme